MFKLPGENSMINQEILKVEIHITEHCNLNCTCCEHFSPLAQEENITMEDFSANLESVYSKHLNDKRKTI